MDYNEFIKVMREHGVKQRDIAKAIGVTTQAVYNGLRPGKELPVWAKAVVFGLNIHERSTVKDATAHSIESKEPIKEEIEIVKPVNDGVFKCGCKITGKLFTRAAGCKISRQEH